MNKIEEIKIQLAAKIVGVTPKTIYNWITDGTLRKTKPGYVLKSDVEDAKLYKVQKRKLMSKKLAVSEMKRDRSGRFIPSSKKVKITFKTIKK